MEVINQELRCLPFAAALMQLVYAFVARELKNLGSPPFSIPQMRYVQAARARVQPVDNSLLLEELIDDSFVKYTNNYDSIPLLYLGIEELHRANFLCFSQHVQLEKTEQNVFISDFQGLSPSIAFF